MLAFRILVLAMLVMHAHKIDWAGAWKALQRYPWQVLGSVWLAVPNAGPRVGQAWLAG